jgi:hypothetical protein
MLELSAKGQITNQEEFSDAWKTSLTRLEEEMRTSWLDAHLVPLEESDPLFFVRQAQAEESALTLAGDRSQVMHRRGDNAELGCEMKVESADSSVWGYIDLATVEDDALVLRDYKAGLVIENTQHDGATSVKQAYKDQLKLYAALYFESKGKWPDRLEVAAPSGDTYEIEFSHEECTELLAEAKSLLSSIKETVAAADDDADAQTALAAPAPSVCRFCSFRPYCIPYWQRAQVEASEEWPRDIWGRVTSLEMGEDGNFALVLELASGEEVRVREISPQPERHPALEGIEEGELIAGFSLRRRQRELSSITGPLTAFYRIEGEDYAAAAGLD